MLEASQHADSSFVTLTYSPEKYPSNGSLDPEDTRLFLMRLRKAIYPKKIRYFLVGEYGDHTQRPHYHLALFGLGENSTEIIRKSWGLGHVLVGSLTKDSAQYVSGYVTKKMTSKDDPRLDGRHPEYARMSLKPGLGAGAMKTVAHALYTDFGADYILTTGDVPMELKHGPKSRPLGRYLRSKLRGAYGFKDTKTPQKVLQSLALKESFEHSEKVSELLKNFSYKEVDQKLREETLQKILNMESGYLKRKVKKL